MQQTGRELAGCIGTFGEVRALVTPREVKGRDSSGTPGSCPLPLRNLQVGGSSPIDYSSVRSAGKLEIAAQRPVEKPGSVETGLVRDRSTLRVATRGRGSCGLNNGARRSDAREKCRVEFGAMNSTERRISVLLSVQRALLGEVGSQLRGVRVSYGEANIRIEAYFDGSITEDDRESMSCVETEVIADFPDSVDVRCEVVRLDAPARLPQVESWVYHRKESVPPSDEPEDDSFLATLQDLVELQNKVRFLARHREGRAILTSLEGAVTRLMAARDDHEDLMGALDPSGDMYRQDKALGHFFVDAVSSVECFAVACHHLGAVIRPEAFDTSTANLARVHLKFVAAAYFETFPESRLAGALTSMASSDLFAGL